MTHRILFLNHVSRLSGAERSLLDLLRRLDRQRFEPLVAVPEDGELKTALQALSVPFVPLPLRRLRKTLNPWRWGSDLLNVAAVTAGLTRLIRRERIALVHANSTTAMLYGGMAARRCGVPCVWHNRDLVSLGPLGRRMGRLASRVIAISECVGRHTARYAGDAGKLAIIYNGIDLEGLAAQGDQAGSRGEFGIPAGAPVFAMVGQLVPWKRHREFIEAAAVLAASLPAARFLIVGEDLFGEHRAYRAELAALADRRGLAGRIVFTGYRADVPRVLSGCDVLIHPAVREPLGRVILEAMALGKPVVAVAACGPAEIIRDGVDGLLTAAGQPEELATAALRLWREPGLAARIGAAACRSVAERFDIRQSIRKLESVYDELLAKDGPPCA